ncbi:MAG TPA: DUF4349 domain-containing protein [Ruminiclostridium sp.]
MYKKLCIWLLILVITTSMIGCGSTKTNNSTEVAKSDVSVQFSQSNDGMQDSNSGADIVAPVAPSSSASNEVKTTSTQSEGLAGKVFDVSQKMIFTGQINFQTLDFEKTRTNLSEYITLIGGYQQNSSVNGGGIGYEGLKSAEYLFRIPKVKYNQAFIDLKKFGTVVLEQSNGEDVTDKYFDTEARLKSLRIQLERLQALLQKADKMDDILKIEKELQTTNYEIENYTGTLKKWDSLVEYSTLAVSIKEVEVIKPVIPKEKNGFFSRIAFGFKNSVIGLWDFLQDFIVAIASALPVVIPLGLIGYLLYRVVRRKIKKSKVDDGEDKKSEN